MTAREHRPGSTGGEDIPGPLYGGPDDDYTPEQLATMSREQLDLLGARYDDVEVLHVEPGPEPGSTLERRGVRQVALLFTIAGLAGFAFMIVYAFSGTVLPDWEWARHRGAGWSAAFTPLLGGTMGLSLVCIGLGLVVYVKQLLPHETAVQDKHDGSHFDQVTTGATLMSGLHNSGLARRKMITRSLGVMAGGVGLMFLAPIGGFINDPTKDHPLGTTAWRRGIRLLREDGTPIRPSDQIPGSMATVYPAVPEGNSRSDSPVMLFRLRPEQLKVYRPLNEKEAGYAFGDYVAFSKICTHAGCPVSLYEQATSRILCPCHQSQFQLTDGAKPVFGPAVRPLPQLPLTVDSEGYFVARGDFPEPVGPSYWNRSV